MSKALRTALGWYQLRIKVEWINLRDWLFARPVIGDHPVAVSLTTYGKRLQTVHTTIQSIVAGKFRPKRLILWLDGEPNPGAITPQLMRLQRRGLEIKYVEDFGPHKKYYPYVREFAEDGIPLVTADDDVIYSKDWLAGLLAAHIAAPTVINCYVARKVVLQNKKFSPYLQWEYVHLCEPSFKNFAIGFAGIIYPAKFLLDLRAAGTGFIEKCPRADDIWLHSLAIRNGYKIAQIAENPDHPESVPSTQDVALANTNQLGGGNDAQIRTSYSSSDIDILSSC